MPNEKVRHSTNPKALHPAGPTSGNVYRALGYRISSNVELDGLPAGGPILSSTGPVTLDVTQGHVVWPPVDKPLDIHPAVDLMNPLPVNSLVLANYSPSRWDWFTDFDGFPATRVRCDLSDRSIEIRSVQELDGFGISYHLIGPVLPYWARRDGRLTLHGAAIDTGRSAIIILGEKGAGKSTLCAIFHRSGHAIYSEDVAAISADLRSVYPGSNMLRTSAETAAALFGKNVQLRKRPFSKHVMHTGPGGEHKALDELPISAIFHLSAFRDQANVKFARLKDPASKFAVLKNLGSTAFPAPPEIRKGEFVSAATLARTIPVFDVTRPRDLLALDDTAAMMLDLAHDPDRAHVE